MYVISKEFHFSASHQLKYLPEEHQCARLHGHNYVVDIELSCGDAELSEPGFVRDYGDLGEFKQWLDTTFDHRHLNDVVPEINPSAENLAKWIHDQWIQRVPELSAVRLSETPKTWATYRAG
jgi:6-pyruvoyltetrahydropterin/6-carboxytetrahydropterin synthase